MDDFVVVLNAGSSSLKFSAYARRPGDAWRVASRGQIEGIGTSPRFAAKDGDGTTVVLRHDRDNATLAVNRLDDIFSASPALADKELYLRGERFLYCIAEAAKYS